jgi:hypothetical protein
VSVLHASQVSSRDVLHKNKNNGGVVVGVTV